MARVKGAMMTRKRRNKTLKLAKSYWGSKSRHFKMAKQAVAKSGVYAYVGRKLKKREFRQLWISRISAAVAPYGINYSRFMNGLKKSGIEMNRKALSELAITDAEAFKVLVETAKKQSNRKTKSHDQSVVAFFLPFVKRVTKFREFFRLCVGVDAHIDPAKRADFAQTFGESAGDYGAMWASTPTKREKVDAFNRPL